MWCPCVPASDSRVSDQCDFNHHHTLLSLAGTHTGAPSPTRCRACHMPGFQTTATSTTTIAPGPILTASWPLSPAASNAHAPLPPPHLHPRPPHLQRPLRVPLGHCGRREARPGGQQPHHLVRRLHVYLHLCRGGAGAAGGHERRTRPGGRQGGKRGKRVCGVWYAWCVVWGAGGAGGHMHAVMREEARRQIACPGSRTGCDVMHTRPRRPGGGATVRLPAPPPLAYSKTRPPHPLAPRPPLACGEAGLARQDRELLQARRARARRHGGLAGIPTHDSMETPASPPRLCRWAMAHPRGLPPALCWSDSNSMLPQGRACLGLFTPPTPQARRSEDMQDVRTPSPLPQPPPQRLACCQV